MKSSAPVVNKRAPLSQYLREGDVDGWTVFSSDDAQAGVESASKLERRPDLSVLKQIKNLLNDEATQDGSFFSNDFDDGAQNFRVDYPFYDSSSEDDVQIKVARGEVKTREQDSNEESDRAFEVEQNVTKEPVESSLVKFPQTTNEIESKTTKDSEPDESSPTSEPDVSQTPEIQTPYALEEAPSPSSQEDETIMKPTTEEDSKVAGDSLATVPTFELRDDDPLERKFVLEERKTAFCEKTLEESTSDDQVESSSNDSKNVQIVVKEETTNPRPFVVDFSETLAPILELQAQGEEIEEPPLIQTSVRRSRRVKKESASLATSEGEETNPDPVEEQVDRAESVPRVRSRYASNARMAIFRRCVDLVSQSAKTTSFSAADKIDLETPSPTFESDASSALLPPDDGCVYGESVEFVAAPCFYDIGSVTSFATTASLV